MLLVSVVVYKAHSINSHDLQLESTTFFVIISLAAMMLELLLHPLFYFTSELMMKASPTYMCLTSQYLATGSF